MRNDIPIFMFNVMIPRNNYFDEVVRATSDHAGSSRHGASVEERKISENRL